MKKNFFYKSHKGQTLVEIAVVIMVATITLVGLVSLAISGLKNAQEAQRKTTATKLANLGIEVVTFCRNAFYNDLQNSCLFPLNDGGKVFVTMPTSGGGNLIEATPNGADIDSENFVSVITTDKNLLYKRRITITKQIANTYLVTSEIKWTVSSNFIGSVSYSRVLTTWK